MRRTKRCYEVTKYMQENFLLSILNVLIITKYEKMLKRFSLEISFFNLFFNLIF